MTPTLTDAPHVTVLADRCAGCQECVVRCPTGALDLDAVTWTVTAHDAACVGCRQCERTCPFAAIVIDGPVLVEPRAALGVHHPQSLAHDNSETRRGLATWEEALTEASRCLDCPDPTCVRGCPAHNDIPGFIRAIGTGNLDEAHRVLRRTSVLPDVCSRVCDQALQCEGACTWSLGGAAPVAIGALERFVCDNAPVPPVEVTATTGAGMTVAVVGSGPAGIAAASELVGAGAAVTVYERGDEP
ncbi:MAG: 4Fe-4S dicluster domain-containing protein, partial [Acidimicrobiales bacterium]